MSKSEELVDAIVEMDEDDALSLAAELLDEGLDPLEILNLCRVAMDEVGARFERNEYFLPELMMAGEMLTQISDMVKPLILSASGGEQERRTHGMVVMGTVHGDLHDIGKNIVTFMLEINGFKVVDLGIDVPIRDFIEAIRQHRPDVVGLSGFLTLAFDSMKQTVQSIEDEGLRDGIKIMVGGGQMDQAVCDYVRADAFGVNAMNAVTLCKDWLEVAA